MKRFSTFALSLALVSSLFFAEAQDTSKGTKKKASGPSVAQQLAEMKRAIEAQQQQINAMGQQLQSRDQRIEQLEQKLGQSQTAVTQAQAKADSASSQTAEQGKTVATLSNDVTDLKQNTTNMAQTLQDTQKSVKEEKEETESPLAIHFKGVTLTPGGFLAGESVYRNRALGADINTPFNSINMPGAGQNAVSEFFGSGRQSRIALLAEGKLDNFKMSGYYEADFLSAGITSNNNQSNSYGLRQRQVWGQVASGSSSLTGGQMWSLLTETKHGLDNRSEALPMTIDPQYTVGFSWARQYAVRATKNFSNKIWAGLSIENSQETLTTHGNTANSYLLGSQGNAGGLYNAAINGCSTSLNAAGAPVTTCSNIANYSWHPTPDFIGKIAFQPGFGHYEVFGILTQFRDRIFPNAGLATPSAAGAFNNSTWTGGGGFNARWLLLEKHVEVGFHGLAGRGVGRYGDAGLSDVTVNPYGSLVPITAYQALATVEYHNP